MIRTVCLAACLVAATLAAPSTAQAAELDCTAGCNQLFNGLFWTTFQVQPAGTGVIDSFLRIQQTTLEEGMNTDYRPLAQDEKTDPNYTRDIQLGEIRQVEIDGVSYYELLLDVNEPSGGGQSFISLIGLRLCVSATGDQYNEDGGGCSGGSDPGSTATQVYDLDGVEDSQVKIDYDFLDTGSGGSDLFVYVPVDLLGTDPDTYLYLWSQFGRKNGAGAKAQDGFEEWAAIIGSNGDIPLPNPTVPEPASLLLFGTGLALTGIRFRRARRKTRLN